MNYWLFKSEAETWSWDQQLKKGERGEPWSGVRNYLARNNMMKMKLGDLGFFYHSGKEKQIVGVVEVIREHYPDRTAGDDDRWQMVDVKAVKSFERPVTLTEIKEHSELENMIFVRQGRLSVSPVSKGEFALLLKLGGISL